MFTKNLKNPLQCTKYIDKRQLAHASQVLFFKNNPVRIPDFPNNHRKCFSAVQSHGYSGHTCVA